MKLSDEARPGYTAEAMVSLGSMDSMYLFTQPMITLKDAKLGVDLGFGGRLPVMSGEAIAGYNLFFDYTDDNEHKRLGAGLEIFYPTFSGHLNVYLPISDDNHGEEALPGIDLTIGIPVPNASFISFWPGFYYYSGRDEDDMSGLSLTMVVKPIQPLAISIGGRNDALQSGRDESELFIKAEVTIPFKRMGKDLFTFDKGQYPLDINAQMDQRVVREYFITYEKQRN
ncbi:MAG: inverse autotransporter beta domain-containing protein [Desulfomonilia bacterium]